MATLSLQLVWMESPTNPTLTVIDIAAVSEIAHKKVPPTHYNWIRLTPPLLGMHCCS